MKECCVAYMNEQFGNDAGLVKEIYGEYVSSMRVKLGDAESALATDEWTQLDRVAHTIKGNALTAGDNEMAQVAIELRSTSQLHDHDQSAACIARLEELAKQL